MISSFSPGAMGLLTPIQSLLEDDQVSEILINRPQEVFYEKAGRLEVLLIPELTERHLAHVFQLIASESEQILDEAHPLLSASLSDGSRVQLVLSPTSVYPTLSIRRKIVRSFLLKDYEKSQFFENGKKFSLKEDLDNLPEEEQQLAQLYYNQDWPEFIKKSI